MSDMMVKIRSTVYDDIFVEFDLDMLTETFRHGLYGLDVKEEFANIIWFEMKAQEDKRREELKNVPSVEPEPIGYLN